jgi:hypothetical protein
MKPCAGSLLEAIESMTKPTDMCRMFRINITGWLIHVNFFLQKSIKKGIIDVKLLERLIISDC